MTFTHVLALTPNGERVSAWRCHCNKLVIVPTQPRFCTHWRVPRPPVAR